MPEYFIKFKKLGSQSAHLTNLYYAYSQYILKEHLTNSKLSNTTSDLLYDKLYKLLLYYYLYDNECCFVFLILAIKVLFEKCAYFYIELGVPR